MTAHPMRREVLKMLGGSVGLGILTACSSSAPVSSKPAESKPGAPTSATNATSAPTAVTKPADAKPAEAKPAAQTAPAAAGSVVELNHWHTLTASDGEVWTAQIGTLNEAMKDQKIHVTAQVVPSDQYGAKILASSTTGDAPDFAWGEGGGRRDFINKGIVVSLDDLVKQAGLDMTDFTDQSLRGATYDGRLYGVPMDALSFQMLINTDHAKEAGLDVSKPPTNNQDLLSWADKMTKRNGDTVTRSGFLMTGSGLHVNLVWGVVAHQMGFRQYSEDLKKAAINIDAAKEAAQWTLDLFDKHKVGTRDVADRYKAFGTGEASIFWTGPWTLSGYVQQKLNFMSALMPAVGKDNSTRGELWNLEMYVQKDKSRYESSIKAIKWLSDNTFTWSTKGRGPTVRKSVLARPDYMTAAYPKEISGAFVEGGKIATFVRPPIVGTNEFTVYTTSGLVAKIMDPVWAKKVSIDDALAQLADAWQKVLDAG
ncbi:MAG: extracellular solute-binding protein [Chloroflexi bacterium]|nr:extracellular solute-binding protein [Chloroflexota bacterium]